tara:strand:+ start:1155 stop:2216 length:1062 start_codon:yes stop_codon:yes gene_type:complete
MVDVNFIFTDMSNNRNYYLYKTDVSMSVNDFIEVSKRENFNFDGADNALYAGGDSESSGERNSRDIIQILADNGAGHPIYAALTTGTNIIDSGNDESMVFNDVNSGFVSISTDVILGDGISSGTGTLGAGGTLSLDGASRNLLDDLTNPVHKVFLFHTSSSDRNVLQRQYSEIYHYSHQATNQNIAFSYILTFFVFVTIVNFALNYKNVNLAQLLILAGFIIYLLFNKTLSRSFIGMFKTSINKMRYADTSTQIMTYLQLLFVTVLLFAFPIAVFLLTSEDFELPSFTETLTNTTVKNTVDDAAAVGYERGSEALDAASDQVNAASEAAAELADEGMKQTNNIRSQVSAATGV